MNEIIKCDLQLFAEGEMSTGSTTEGTVTEGSGSADTSNQFATGQETSDSPDVEKEAIDRSKAFKELISGEYKQEYQQTLEKTLSRRMKNKEAQIKAQEEYQAKITPALEKLAIKYGLTDASDIDRLLAEIDRDNSFYEEYAMEHNVTTDQAKVLIQAERINRQEQERQANAERDAMFQKQYMDWLDQAQDLQLMYPGFNFDLESENEDFRRLLNNGVDVRTAYEVIHRDEIMSGVAQYTYARAKQEQADQRTARQSRPNENGVTSLQASNIEDNWNGLSKEQRQRLNEAARRGERVTPDNFRNYL